MKSFKEFLSERTISSKNVELIPNNSLIYYMREDEREAFESAIENNADYNYDYGQGWRPLHYASREPNTYYIERLVELGADIDAQTEIGDTPLHLASKNVQPKNILKLLELKADPNIKNKMGKAAWEVYDDMPNLRGSLIAPIEMRALRKLRELTN